MLSTLIIESYNYISGGKNLQTQRSILGILSNTGYFEILKIPEELDRMINLKILKEGILVNDTTDNLSAINVSSS